METEELVEALQTTGLSPYQADAYVALLDLGTASATKLAEASDVPKPRIYDVLDALEDRGYVETYETDSLRARAHSPSTVLSNLRDHAETLESAADEVERRWEEPELEQNQMSIVREFQTVLDRARTFIREAETQIQLSVTPEDFASLRPALVDAHERGVSTRITIHTERNGTAPTADELEGTCLEARHRPIPAPFVALVDREKSCFVHHPDSLDHYGVLVNDRTHTYVFHWYFLTCLWESWETIYRDTSSAREYVDIRECVRDILPLLQAGATVRVEVEGHELATGDRVTITGTVEDAMYEGAVDSPDTVQRLAGEVSLVVDTGEETVTVGGWGAMIEDVETTNILVREVVSPDGTPVSDALRGT